MKQKGESQNGYSKRAKRAKISEKQTFLIIIIIIIIYLKIYSLLLLAPM